MKFIYLSDTHLKGKNPENRISNYCSDIMLKIKEVVELSKQYQVDYVFHGGDLFNSPFVSNTIVDDLIDLIEEAKIDWYIISGNHDEIGANFSLSQSATLPHIFRRSKYIKHLEKLEIKNSKNEIVEVIEGFDYYYNIENDIKEKGLMSEYTDPSILKIAILHAFLTPKPFLSHVVHVQLKDIKTNFDVVLCSHFHFDWGIIEIGKTKYINLGAIGRQGIDEVNRVPKILLADTEKDTWEIIDLKSAKVGKDVFDIGKIEEMKLHEENIEHFIKGLTDLKLQSLDIKGKLEEIAKNKNTDRRIVNLVAERLSQFENKE